MQNSRRKKLAFAQTVFLQLVLIGKKSGKIWYEKSYMLVVGVNWLVLVELDRG
jgi:hypothetical protein